LDLKTLGLTGRQRLRDLWRQQDIGTVSDLYTADILGHGVLLLRIYPQK